MSHNRIETLVGYETTVSWDLCGPLSLKIYTDISEGSGLDGRHLHDHLHIVLATLENREYETARRKLK